jgi:hypothetical protein
MFVRSKLDSAGRFKNVKGPSRIAVLWAAPLVAFRLAAAAEEPKIHECVDAKGEVVYQDGPCIEPAPAPAPAKPKEVVKPPGPAKTQRPAKAATAKTAPAPTEPASKPTSKPPATLSAKLVSFPPSPQRSRRLEPPPFGLPVDARWETPARTLQTFIGAVSAGDRALAVSCLAGSALADLGPEPEELPLEALQLTVKSFTGYVPEGDLGPFWSIRALRAGLRPKWIFFERTMSGEWKIDGI